MKTTGFRRRFGTVIAVLTAISLTFASCTADSGEENHNTQRQGETTDDNEQKTEVVQPAVTGLSAKIGDGKVVLSWTNPTNEEFSSLEVSYTPDETSSSKTTLTKDTTTHTFTSLTNDMEYTFTVTAISSTETTGTATVKATPKIIQLTAPTNLVINSITDSTNGCAVNFSFTYNGDVEIDGTTTAILGYSTTDDSSKATYDTSSAVTVEAGENTKTATISNFHPELGAKYYFWLKLTNTEDNVLDSCWCNDAGFTYLVGGKDTKYLARFVCTGEPANEVNSIEGADGELYAQVDWDMIKVNGQCYFIRTDSHYIHCTFKSLDENTGTAYFYATALAGYYIKDGQAVALPYYISGNEFEINPETNYWRCK